MRLNCLPVASAKPGRLQVFEIPLNPPLLKGEATHTPLFSKEGLGEIRRSE